MQKIGYHPLFAVGTPSGIGGSKGGARDARPPPGVQILSFHAVFGKKLAK